MTDAELNQPATRRDIEGLRQEIKADMEGLRHELKADMEGLGESLRQELSTLIRDVETSLLRAFHGYAETNDHRLKRVETAEFQNAERLAVLERRVTEVELRLPRAGS